MNQSIAKWFAGVTALSCVSLFPYSLAFGESNALPNPNVPKVEVNAPVKVTVAVNESEVLKQIHQINQNEISAGKLAENKGATKPVRDYGKRLVDDHRSADKKVSRLADTEKVDLSDISNSSLAQEQLQEGKMMMDQLQNLQGENFDSTFASSMYTGHKDAIATLSKEEKDLKGTQTAQLIHDLLPVLKTHEQIAENLQKKLAE